MKVHVNDPIHEDGIQLLEDEGFEVTTGHLEPKQLRERLSTCHGVIVRSATKIGRELLLNTEYLKVVGRAGVGVDNIDLDACEDLGIVVANAPTGATQSVAELTIGHVLSLLRQLPRADAATKEGRWIKSELLGRELHGKTLGLVGSGRIGARVAEIAQAFGADVLTYDPYLTQADADAFGAELLDDLHAMLADSDVVSIHCPLTDETAHMISADELAAMPDDAIVVNCARGGILDEAALADALEAGEVAGAALDVYETEPPTDSPLLDRDDVSLSPHIGASTAEAKRRVGVVIAEQVVAALSGDEVEHRVV